MALLLSATVFAEKTEIRLRRSATVSDGSICLADIADIRTDSAENRNRLAGLVVAQIPPNAQTFSIGFCDIGRSLALAQINPAQVDIYGASYCRLNLDRQSTPTNNDGETETSPAGFSDVSRQEEDAAARADTLGDELGRMVAQAAGWPQDQLKIQWRCDNPEWLEQPADKNRFEIKPCSTVTLGEVSFDVVDRQPERVGAQQGKSVVRVRGNVELLCQSVVSARDLLPGEVVTEKDVKLVPRRINNLRDLAFSATQMVLGQEIARSLPAETVIRSSMIRKLILVKRNQNVALRSQVGQVQISVEGTALDNGAGGDLVQVRYGNKNKTVVRGRVTGPGFVVVTDEIPDEAVEVTAAAAEKPYPESQTVPRKNNDRQD